MLTVGSSTKATFRLFLSNLIDLNLHIAEWPRLIQRFVQNSLNSSRERIVAPSDVTVNEVESLTKIICCYTLAGQNLDGFA